MKRKPLHIKDAGCLLQLVRKAAAHGVVGSTEKQAAIAQEIFNNKKPNWRLVQDDKWTVDTYWDVRLKAFVSSARKTTGEVSPTMYASKLNAPLNHLRLLYRFLS